MNFIADKTSLLKNNGINYLYCEKKIPSSYGCDEKILFLIEQKDLSPVLPIFSTLRNNFIDVNTLDDIEKIIEEDTKYKSIVDNFLDSCFEAEKILLRSFQ